MSSLLYPKLAAINIRKHARLYLPYLISSAVTIAMFYVMVALANNDGISKMRGSKELGTVLFLGIVVIGIFSTIFLIYTNSFLVKQRTSEFGLYSVLGMEKRHIGKVMFFETVFSFLISITVGLATGVLFYKLIALFLCKLLRFEIALGFYVSVFGLVITSLVFGGIFFLCLIINVIRVRRANAINLLKSKNAGEKEPRTKWIMAILGALCLAGGYTISIVVESPLTALGLFFVAVLLVIFGTYFLFIAGSIALLKILRKNKNYYYNVKHFNSVSGMLYRMKQNATGLANICILSTMVLVMVSTTVSMYAGTEDALVYRYPTDISIEHPCEAGDAAGNEELLATVKKLAAQSGREIKDLKSYTYLSCVLTYENAEFLGESNDYSAAAMHHLCFMTADEYNRLTGKNVTLGNDEVAVNCSGEQLADEFKLCGTTYKVAQRLDGPSPISKYRAYVNSVDYIVVADTEELKSIVDAQIQLLGIDFSSNIKYEINFNTDGTDEQKAALSHLIDTSTHKTSIDCRQASRDEVYAMYGSFLFLGIVLGTLFLLVTVMIIYYKQISEGYDDAERFRIMQQVGMSREEVKKTIGSQVLTVFFLPLVTAFIHLAFSFPIITRLLAVMNLTNTTIFVCGLIATALVFTVIYTAVYLITSRNYYKIVS